MSGGKFSIEAIFTAKDRFSPMLGTIQGRVSRFRVGIGTAFSDVGHAIDGVIGKLSHLAIVGGALGLAGLGIGLAHVAESGLHFEQAITDVGSVMGKTRGEIAELEDSAKHLGIVTQFSATEVAEGMEMMARKGFHAHEILSMMPGVLDAVAASGEDMKGVSSIVGSALRSFQLDAKDASHVADVLAFSSERVGATISDMGTALALAGPTAKALGVSIEDTAAAVGLLQKIGIDASTAGTATATMLAKITKPSKEAAQEMAAMGIKFEDAKGNMLSFRDVLGQFVKVGDKAGGNMKRMAFLAELVGLRGDKAAIGLSDMMKSGDFDKLADGLAKVDGYAKLVATRRLDTTNMSWKLLGSTVDVLSTKLYELKSKSIRGVIDGTNQWIQANQDLIVSDVQSFLETSIRLVKDFGLGFAKGFGEATGPLKEFTFWALKAANAVPGLGSAATTGEKFGKLAGVLLTVAVGVKAVTLAMGLFNAVAAANPYTALLVGLLAIGSAYVLYKTEVDEFAKRHKVLFGVIATGVGIYVAAKVAANAWQGAILLIEVGQKAVALATWAANGAQKAWTASLGLASAAETLFTGEVVAATAATEGAAAATATVGLGLGALLGVLGAVGLALGAVIYQWQQLEQMAGGHVWEGVKGVFNGKGFFGAIDAAENEDARRKYAADHPGAPAVAGAVPAVQGAQSDAAMTQAIAAAAEAAKKMAEADRNGVIEVRLPAGASGEVPKQPSAGGKIRLRQSGAVQ